MTPTLLAALETTIVEARAASPAGSQLLAIGWSTVDIERAARGFGAEPPFDPPTIDGTLGATCQVLDVGAAVPLVLVEPVTEGPLTASLARLGEGPAVRWYRDERTGFGPVVGAAAAASAAAGPFGPEVPLHRASATRFVFLVLAEAGTITP